MRRVRLDLGGELEEEAQLTDLHRLFHDVHAVEVVEDDGLQDEVACDWGAPPRGPGRL